MKDLLQQQRDGEHWLYVRLREGLDEHSVERREFFSTLWEQYEPFAPRGFLKKLQIEFHQRWWEMYLFVGMLRVGFQPDSSKSDTGPDISLKFGDRLVFVEAIAPTAGTQPDRVPMPILNGVGDFPERECLLRFTQALTDKCKKMRDYMDRGVIRPDACAVIALSASDLNLFGSFLDAHHPAPLSVLAGAGATILPTGGGSWSQSSHRRMVQRNCGSEVDTVLFEKPDFSIISGVLYSPVDLWNATREPEDSISLFVNPLAEQTIPGPFLGRLVTWVEHSRGDDKVVWKKVQPKDLPHSEAAQGASL